MLLEALAITAVILAAVLLLFPRGSTAPPPSRPRRRALTDEDLNGMDWRWPS